MDSQQAHEKANEFFNYEPKTGNLTWKVRRRLPVGSVVGYVSKDGYRYTKFNGKYNGIHRLVWLLRHGYLPENGLDHVIANMFNVSRSNIECIANGRTWKDIIVE